MADELKTYTVADVAEMLQSDPDYIYDRVKDGTMSCYRIGHKIRFSAQHIRDFLKSKERIAKQEIPNGET